MRITIFAAGSQGDIQPCLLLGKALHAAGFQVLLAAPQNFAGFAAAHHLPFHALRGDVQQIMAGETGRKYMQSGGNPLQSILAMRKMLGPIALQMAEDALEACREADALVSLAVFATLGETIAEVRGIPLLHVEPTPLLPSREFPAPGFPLQRNLGGMLNRLSGFAMLAVIWQWYRPFVNQFRSRFRLPTLSSASFHRILISRPLLGAYSPAVIPRQRDWPETTHLTGYWFQDEQPGWQPSAGLQAFLEAGEPPVYVGFGSMTGNDPQRISGVVLEALQRSGLRGVLATGWGGMRAPKNPGSVFVIEAAPHAWLFPRMAVVVHHGGAGTTAEGLRAGKPSLIVPFIVDQTFWGRRVHALGAGPQPIQARELAVEALVVALQAAIQDGHMRQRAQAIGESIRAEDGLGNAVRLVRQYLGA